MSSDAMATELRTPPIPGGAVPILGHLLEGWRDPLSLLLRSSRDHGDVVLFRFAHLRYYLVNDLDAIRRVLVDNHKNYTKSQNYKGLKLVLGTGLLTSEGDFWRRQRKLVQPAFHRERLTGFARSMTASTRDMLDRWAESADPTRVIDAHEEMMRLTFRIVGQTLLSTELDGEAREMGKAITVVLYHANEYAQAIAPLPVWAPTPKNLQFKRAMRTLDTLVQRIIDERRARPDQGKDDLLSMLMAVKDAETGETMSDRQLRDEVMTLVLAGHETTANALAWTLYLLSRHPDVERRLAAEVAQVLGDRPPSFADLPKLPFCMNVVQESMRLYPPAWAFERQAIEDDVLAGYTIPAGSIVSMSPYALHRDPAHWENPEGFDPDRFLPERSEGRSRHAYMPFGGGPRQCIGNSFALMEAQIVIASIVQRFRLALVPGHPVELDPVITLRPKNGIKMTLEPRAASVKPRSISSGDREDGRMICPRSPALPPSESLPKVGQPR
jgi:cytochrome P450